MEPKTEPLYFTLDASGNGSVQYTARKSGILTTVVKVTVEMVETSSGVVSILKNGGTFLTSMPVAPKMETAGSEGLYSSEFLTFVIENGPSNATVKINVHYEEGAEP